VQGQRRISDTVFNTKAKKRRVLEGMRARVGADKLADKTGGKGSDKGRKTGVGVGIN